MTEVHFFRVAVNFWAWEELFHRDYLDSGDQGVSEGDNWWYSPLVMRHGADYV